eukprot:GHVN01072419.1.p1 GENE.GHVN01072419.1~~GHVN01072419.1.p1  ORF type:complete len:154 (+),score=18.75 GHVN01072419.1:575-1036(+)
MSGGVVSTPSGQSSGTVMSPSGPSGGSIISPIDQGSVASGGVTSPPRAPGVVAPPPRAASLTRDEVAAFFPSIYGVSRRDVEQVLSSQFGIRDPVVGRLKAKGPQDPSVAQFLSLSCLRLDLLSHIFQSGGSNTGSGSPHSFPLLRKSKPSKG